jgi:SAM-dependent methyltransferase
MSDTQTAATRISLAGQFPRKGSYGIDAPYFLPILGILFAINAVNAVISRKIPPLIAALLILFCGFWGLHASKRGKFLVWADLLNELKLHGDEKVLDLGCGRGAVLFLAAQHLSSGTAVGVDIWNRADQSGNSEQAARRNAVAEGVADRIELVTGDMTQLPMESDQFDLIVSNVAIHNVKGRERRAKALEEAVRVLRPGGRLLIADLRCTSFYREHLATLGMIDVARRNLGWRMWWSGPWAATRLVSARKPVKNS